jgi:hypothetical protein
MATDPSVLSVQARVDSLDEGLLRPIEAQLSDPDRRTLLALHAAVAQTLCDFAYLEIGSFKGGSLQAIIQDPRCSCVFSIDLRTSDTPDTRGSSIYADNTTERMRELLRSLPNADLAKLTTFDTTTADLVARDLPRRPDYCFIDGEHTHEAVLRDARFCAEAVNGEGVIAFHDQQIVTEGIRAFLRESWSEVSHAMALPSLVFVVELGGRGVLRAAPVERAIGSRWHSAAWRYASRPARTSLPLVATWVSMPVADKLIFDAKQLLGGSRRR